MPAYDQLRSRLADKEVIILDGAIGTQLQSMGVPVDNRAWAALALIETPETVQAMHKLYIDVGAEVITTNTFPAARHNLEGLGAGERTAELNQLAVRLAREACAAAEQDRPLYVAGSISSFGIAVGGSQGSAEFYAEHFGGIADLTEQQARANLKEQAQILADAGCDLLIAEDTGNTTQRQWVTEACVATGLPVWVGFRCGMDRDGTLTTGYYCEEPMEGNFASVLAIGGEVATIFHSHLDATLAAIPLLKQEWQGPIGVYPEGEREDYVDAAKDPETKAVTPEEFIAFARACVAEGVQIVGGCCGIELEHMRGLRAALEA